MRAGGFFQGYSSTVWAMVSLDSLGGLLVSALLKYTTATLKNFAAPIGSARTHTHLHAGLLTHARHAPRARLRRLHVAVTRGGYTRTSPTRATHAIHAICAAPASSAHAYT